MIRQPFDEEQIKNINEYQNCGAFHPLTCYCGNHILLEPKRDGLWCPRCGRFQNWIHKWIADGSWKFVDKGWKL